MRIRRCAILFLEPREEVAFDLDDVLRGGPGLSRRARWIALAPHLGEEVDIDASERDLLGQIAPGEWTRMSRFDASQRTILTRLLEKGLVIGSAKAHVLMRARDEALRGLYWHPLAATLHAFTRWSGADAVQAARDSGTDTAAGLRRALGAPPPEARISSDAAERLPLPRSEPNEFDRLLARRATCRNFDTRRPLPFGLFAQLLERVFAAQAQVRVADDTVFLKKTSPSGGGLHPVEAYLLVRNVEGVAPGLYHYHSVAHGLETLPSPDMPLEQLALDAVAGQDWFADAHAMVLLAPRFDRTFWKYRQHAKAYRVIALEAGHLSQTLYLAATEAGLGAFITGAINEVLLERAFGLDPLCSGVMAVCGFGWRGEQMQTAEFDPAEEIWTTQA